METYEKGYAILNEAKVKNDDIETIKEIINEYSNNFSYSEIDYWQIERKIRDKIPSITIFQVKTVLEGLYWQGHFTDILGQMKAPTELLNIQEDYDKKGDV
jgi:hypothetical protein